VKRYDNLVSKHWLPEKHVQDRTAWLRAAVLGAEDGISSVTSLMIGVAAAAAPKTTVLLSGVAGIVGGAMSMAAGEYVSVSSQRDAEEAEIEKEKAELAADPSAELGELAAIYRKRGLDPDLAEQVAEQLSRHDLLETHLRDELGLHNGSLSRPWQAALVSATSFASLASVPIITLLVTPERWRQYSLATTALFSLGLLGGLGAFLGGGSRRRATMRVMLGGGLAMAFSDIVGRVLAQFIQG
jgi:VIT1/CCC1 family predicted Fe2+/Mn2+ transporter